MPVAIRFVAMIKSRWRTAVRVLCVLGCCMTSNGFAAATFDPAYIGSQTCAECHRTEYDRWQGSHHDLAMQPAKPHACWVISIMPSLPSLASPPLSFARMKSSWCAPMARTAACRYFEILYTFGVYPLQQYLIEFPGGRMQALSIVWDARPQSEGGQRWFHLYPDEKDNA